MTTLRLKLSLKYKEINGSIWPSLVLTNGMF